MDGQRKSEARIQGTVTEAVSGKPVEGVRIEATGPWYANTRTNTEGHYSFDSHPGEWDLRFYTPTAFQQLITSKTIRIARGDCAEINLQVDPELCHEPACASFEGTFSGRYAQGFEQSWFEPEGNLVHGPGGEQRKVRVAWVRFSRGALSSVFHWDKHYQVRWKGTLTGPGAFGHMDGADYSLVVDEVLDSVEIPEDESPLRR